MVYIALAGRSILAYRQQPNLKHILKRGKNRIIMFTWKPDPTTNPDVYFAPTYTSTATSQAPISTRIRPEPPSHVVLLCDHLSTISLWIRNGTDFCTKISRHKFNIRTQKKDEVLSEHSNQDTLWQTSKCVFWEKKAPLSKKSLITYNQNVSFNL